MSFPFRPSGSTPINPLSLHDALPISLAGATALVDRLDRLVADVRREGNDCRLVSAWLYQGGAQKDRKSTRLNSSHSSISYAVFCLKKKSGGRSWSLGG